METIILILVCFLGIFVQLALHELGHLAAAVRSGWRFLSFQVLNLMFYKENGRLKVRKTDFAGLGASGTAVLDGDLHGEYALKSYFLGGPAVSILAGAAIAALGLLFPQNSIAGSVCYIQGGFGVLYGIFNLLPLKGGINDRMNLECLTKNQEARESFWKMCKAAEKNQQGIRLKDCPREWFSEEAKESYEDIFSCGWAVYEQRYYRETGEYEKAEKFARAVLNSRCAAPGQVSEAKCECAFYEMEKGESEIQKILDAGFSRNRAAQIRPSIFQYHILYAWEKFANGNEREARLVQEKFEEAAKHYAYPAQAQLERETIYKISLKKS